MDAHRVYIRNLYFLVSKNAITWELLNWGLADGLQKIVLMRSGSAVNSTYCSAYIIFSTAAQAASLVQQWNGVNIASLGPHELAVSIAENLQGAGAKSKPSAVYIKQPAPQADHPQPAPQADHPKPAPQADHPKLLNLGPTTYAPVPIVRMSYRALPVRQPGDFARPPPPPPPPPPPTAAANISAATQLQPEIPQPKTPPHPSVPPPLPPPNFPPPPSAPTPLPPQPRPPHYRPVPHPPQKWPPVAPSLPVGPPPPKLPAVSAAVSDDEGVWEPPPPIPSSSSSSPNPDAADASNAGNDYPYPMQANQYFDLGYESNNKCCFQSISIFVKQ